MAYQIWLTKMRAGYDMELGEALNEAWELEQAAARKVYGDTP